MKKIFTLILGVLFCMAANAQTDFLKKEQRTSKFMQKQNAIAKNVPAAAEADGFTIKFCDDLETWFRASTQSNLTYKCYIYITPEMATSIAGNKITEISFSYASNTTATKAGTVFVSENINSLPITATECTVNNCAVTAEDYQTVALKEPYIVKENTGFYFGYTVEKCNSTDYPLGADYAEPTAFAGTVEVFSATGTSVTRMNMGTEMGVNLFLTAKTVGEAKGFHNCFSVGDLSLGYFTLPVVEQNSVKEFMLDANNAMGSNALTSIEYSIDLNGAKGETKTLDINVPAGRKYGTISLPAPDFAEGRNSITLNIYKINGVELNRSSSTQCIALNNSGYDRKFVVEEGTGTWCGWCPRGIVGLDKMSDKYPEKFIGIAVHSGDAMQVSSYSSFIDKYFTGFPSCIINRDPVYNIDPNYELLDMCYTENAYWGSQRGAAKIDINVTQEEDEALNVTATTTFAFNDEKADYKLAFVILEDGLVAKQTNYYSGGGSGKMEGWETKTNPVSWAYMHTARDIFNVFGINNSLPSTIVAGEPMTYSTTLSLRNVSDPETTSVVALILDTKTGTILNAVKAEYGNYGTDTGIDSPINNSTNQQINNCYNLAGQKVSQNYRGIVIKNGKKMVK